MVNKRTLLLKKMTSSNIKIYTAKIVYWYDGDTCTVDINLGLGVVLKAQKIRLIGIDTPEMRGVPEAEKARAVAAKEFAETLAPDGSVCLIETDGDKRCKYGRILGKIFTPQCENGLSINELLVKAGYSKNQDGENQ